MSRTIKDKPYHLIVETKNKKKRFYLPENYHWYLNEPRWWKHMYTTKKRRAEFKNKVTMIIYSDKESLELLDISLAWNKPHVYYW